MSSPIKLATQAGFTVFDNPGEPIRWGVSQQVFQRAARFQDFIREVILAQDSTPGLLGARLVALDAVPVDALNQICQAAPYRCPTGVAIEWEAEHPTRTERRLINPLTVKCLIKTDFASKSVASSASGHPNMTDELHTYLKQSDAYKSSKRPLQELELDAICGWHEMLPASLFAHACGLQPLSALSRSTLARNATQMALHQEAQTADEPVDSVYAELVDSTLDSMGDDSSSVGVNLLLSILKDHVSPVDGVTKRAWLMQLSEQRHRFASHGPVTCLLSTWVAHMLEEGTIGTTNPTAETVARYARHAAQPLRIALTLLHADLGEEPWQTDILRGVYTAILESHNKKNIGTMRSALSNFHHFLSEMFEVEPLRVPLPGETEIARVKANSVWPHELKLAMEWAVQHPDARIGAGARLLLAIGSEAPARIEELQRLRMRHLSFFSSEGTEFAVIEIARHAASGRLKTSNSQRRLTVTKTDTLNLLKAWYQQREAEGAPLNAYLFGDPTADSARYRTGITHAFVNRLLKSVTGDSQVSFHSLRHTVISGEVESIWSPYDHPSIHTVDVNRLEILAAESGHASPISTLCTYSHRYEAPLREWMDRCIWANMGLTSNEVAKMTGMNASAIRQKMHRMQISLPRLAQNHFEGEVKKLSGNFQCAEEAFKWREPQPPTVGGMTTSQLMPFQALEIIHLLYEGKSTHTVATRYGLNTSALIEKLAVFLNECHHLAKAIFPRKYKNTTSLPSSIFEVYGQLEVNPHRLYQTKFKPVIERLKLEVDTDHLINFATSIEHLQHGHYLALTDKTFTVLLMHSLRYLCVPGEQLRICIGDRQPQDSEDLSHLGNNLSADAIHSFEIAFLHPPKIQRTQHRPDRPHVYLLWDSATNTESTSAGSSVEGLFAIARGIRFFLTLKEK